MTPELPPAPQQNRAGPRRGLARCVWCSQLLPASPATGRRRKYCSQACRQRAYESRSGVARATIPENATVLSPAQRDDLADRLFIVRCAAEDLATALEEQADRAELQQLVNSLLQAAYAAEALR